MNKEDFKKRVTEEINNYKDKLQELALKLLACPELGFKEQKTAGYLKEELEKLGLIIDDPVALTGFKGSFKTGKKGPKVAILGELDSIICYKHPRADRSTGAAQACGHYAQLVSLLGVAAGLKKSGVLDKLAGEVVFMAVPAEEYIDLEFREKLIDDGVIKYKSGKQQAIWEGHFDDINIALMSHILPDEYLFKVYAGMKSNTFVSKSVTFIGKESHAGATPHLGINALNMAVLALNNINAQRETFPEEDKVRIHSIITNCGDAVNVIPGEVTMETKVRGASLDIMKRAAEKVDRCLHAASYAVGGNVIIKNEPGYLPLINNNTLMNVYIKNMGSLIGQDKITDMGSISASFDFGDITHLIPGLHSFICAAEGSLHSKDFNITNENLAFLDSAKALAMTVIDLLFDDGELAKKIISNYKPLMIKDEYLKYLDNNSKTITDINTDKNIISPLGE